MGAKARLGMLAGAGLLTVLALPGHARAAGFDCTRARAADEVAVCRDRRLSEMDSEMSALWYAYSRVPMLMGGNGARMDAAQAFLARRRACRGNVVCLTAAYRARIDALRRDIDKAMAGFRHFVSG
ncbi:MAG: hypothetical protein JWO81_2607 [Alphaproteobacteria bacterium]|nr:hypothetical protein [Alphaproteobacteria bacterium]